MGEVIVKKIRAKNILSKSNLPVGDYSVNPYTGCAHACKYCYASFMKRFTKHSENWGEFLDVKYWDEIKNPEKYSGKEIFMSSVTDPYNPQEKIYERTRNFLEQMQGSRIKLSIQTKSDLILRDLDLIKNFPEVRVGFSINTLDENFKNQMDNAPEISRRLAAMEKIHAEGIRATCFISPIFPGITDVKKIIDRVKNFCNLIWLENLNLRGNFKPDILNFINEFYPELFPIYKEIYLKGKRDYWENLDREISDFAKKSGLPYVRNDDNIKSPFEAPPTIVNFFYHEEIKKSATKK